MHPASDNNVQRFAWYLLTKDGSLSVRVLSGLTVGVDASGGLVFNGLEEERLVIFDVDHAGLQFEVVGNSHKVHLNQLPVEGKLSLTLNCQLMIAQIELKFDCRLLDSHAPSALCGDSFKILIAEIGESVIPEEDSSVVPMDEAVADTAAMISESSESPVISDPAEIAFDTENTEKLDEAEQAEESEVIVLNALPEVIVAEAPVRMNASKRKSGSGRGKIAAILVVAVGAVWAWYLYQPEDASDIKQLVDAVVSPILTPDQSLSHTEPEVVSSLKSAVADPTVLEMPVQSESVATFAEEIQLASWLEEGDLLLSQGFWTRGRDTAAARYLTVLRVDGDNRRAVAGMEIIYAGILRMSDPVAKSRSLAAMHTLVLDFPVLQNLKKQIELTRQPNEVLTLASSLEVARALMADGFISEPANANAVRTLQKILIKEPGNSTALGLLQQCAERLVSTAREADVAGFSYEARNLIEEVLAFLPQHQQANTLWRKWQDDGYRGGS